ncbi:uncharacterized protein LOC143884584 [Tasmannia lanceolata]|uniref:uncharacterized protein LOC143884584 n=1 Tax=Tasmannia lanceolata TaxID=3420 RepID=UPI004062C9E8
MGTRIAISQNGLSRQNVCYENYDPCFPDQPVVDLYLPMWASQRAFRSKPAFIWAEDNANRSAITYAQLNSSVQSIADQLLISCQRGDTVLILSSPGLDLVKILFSCQRAGLLSVPIFPPGPSFKSTKDNYHHLIRVLLQTKPKVAVADRAYIASIHQYISFSSNDTQLSQLLQNIQWLSVEDFEQDGNYSSMNSSTYSGCKPNELYLIQYTSGATGIPKPVLVTAGSAAHNVRTARKAYDLQPSSVIMSWLPQYHDCGLMFLLLTIVSGATCVLTSPTTFVNRPRFWLELITEFEATCTPVPSFALPLVVKRGGVDQAGLPLKLGSMTNLVLINEPIYRTDVKEFSDKFACVGLHPSSISPSYGLAENCTFVSTAWRSIGESGNFPNIPSYNRLLPSARLGSSLTEGQEEEEEMKIIVVNEETCEPVEDGIEGEIWVCSPSNADGYLGYPSLTREVFQARVRGSVSGNFVRTGDRGIVRGEERYLFVTGRASDMIKISDKLQFHPHYLETTAYKSCPDHLRGGCIAVFEISKMIVVVAELQREGGVGLYRGISKRIKEAVLKHEKIRVRLVVLVKSGSVPKTTSGKIQRWLAKEKLLRSELGVVNETWFNDGQTQAPAVSLVHARKGKRVEDGGEREEPVLSFRKDHHHFSLLSFL